MPLSYTDRQALVARRKTEFPAAHPPTAEIPDVIDFAPPDGRCYHCRGDLVAHHGEKYPTTYITGCPFCHYSYCE